MSITYRILGAPGRDNAALVQIDSGQSLERLLFDCGEGCLADVSFSEVQAVDHLFFSHFHMDHVGGFDTFFRCNFDRTSKPNQIWGPPESAHIVQHRFQGFLWNLHDAMAATWRVMDIHPERIHTTRFELGEAFAVAHDEGSRAYDRTICEGAGYTVEALTMDHRTPTLAYIVREKTRRNVDPSRLAALGLRPGTWLKELKESTSDAGEINIAGATHSLGALREALVTETPGDSLAYLTDFQLDDTAIDRLATALDGCRTVICEGQYRHADLALARKNYHMTTVLSATLAKRANIGELILFHLSDRYERGEWQQMLRDAREIFPNTSCPAAWGLNAKGAG